MQMLQADTRKVHVTARGLVTLPQTLREAYGIRPGDRLTLLDLGGVFVLSRGESGVDALADHVAVSLQEQGEDLESLLDAIREERARKEA
jgi:bifunctional DNA-binding transcriptional regulator/antitoxin component of YhaV-PrlF toxin-antitoxin module